MKVGDSISCLSKGKRHGLTCEIVGEIKDHNGDDFIVKINNPGVRWSKPYVEKYFKVITNESEAMKAFKLPNGEVVKREDCTPVWLTADNKIIEPGDLLQGSGGLFKVYNVTPDRFIVKRVEDGVISKFWRAGYDFVHFAPKPGSWFKTPDGGIKFMVMSSDKKIIRYVFPLNPKLQEYNTQTEAGRDFLNSMPGFYDWCGYPINIEDTLLWPGNTSGAVVKKIENNMVTTYHQFAGMQHYDQLLLFALKAVVTPRVSWDSLAIDDCFMVDGFRYRKLDTQYAWNYSNKGIAIGTRITGRIERCT